MLVELDGKLKSGDLNMCVSQCQKAGAPDDVQCMRIKARTVAEVEACVGPGGDDEIHPVRARQPPHRRHPRDLRHQEGRRRRRSRGAA